MRTFDDQRGVTTVEYAVMLILVAAAVLAFGGELSKSVTSVFSAVSSSLQAALK